MQKAVDALALAAAAELDGGPNAITRARAAMQDMLQNGARFNDGPDARFRLANADGGCPSGANCVRVDFLHDIPPSDDTPIDDRAYPTGLVTTDPALASFAWVRARNVPGSGDFRQTMTTLFPVNLMGGEGRTTLAFGAEAVAGGTGGASGEVCGLAPVYICNPFEGLPPGEELDDDLSSLHDLVDPDNSNYGRHVSFREQGGKGAHAGGPGNYGYIGCEGANCVRDALAAEDSGICTENGRTFTQPGFVNNAAWGINVRFDQYGGGLSDTSEHRPSANVRDGFIDGAAGGDTGGGGKGGGKGGGNDGSANSACGQAIGPAGEVMGLEGDRNLESSPGEFIEIEGSGSTIGKGDWDFEQYWQINFGHENAKGAGMGGYDIPNGWSNNNPPSRYELYRHEIEWNGGEPLSVPSIGGETGVPSCYTGDEPPPTDEPDRRLIKVAIVNCNEEDIRGRSTISVAFYAELFLTTPVGHTGTLDRLFEGELVSVSGVDGGGSFGVTEVRPEVLLYR